MEVDCHTNVLKADLMVELERLGMDSICNQIAQDRIQ